MKTTLSLLFFPIFIFAQNLSLDSHETYAVVVGISDYQDEDIPDLRFADKDALAFAGFLQSPAGGSLDEDHLKVLINEQATVAQFAIALDWLWEVVEENDKVIIYFSGHGDVERKSLTQPGFLLCWDAPSQVYLAGGTLALPMFQEVISTLSVQNKAKVIVITDACRSGKLSGSSVGGSQLTSNNLAKQYANEIKILSCQPDEYSIEGEQWGGGRGAFSYHLLDGLYGLADGNNDLSVNLLEIGRYLEDHVSTEVAPHSQIPMTVGSRGEKLTTIFPDILDQIKEGKRGQMQLFTATESRSIENEVLAQADSNIVEMYFAFKKSLKDKQFLCAEASQAGNNCAEFYYKKLTQESGLEKLHASMKRNYAAALQDDAQQVLNRLLEFDPSICYATNRDFIKDYGNVPQLLERAAELLGEGHYMFSILKARQNWFEGYLKHCGLKAFPEENTRITSREKFKTALDFQPEMPQAYLGLGNSFIFSDEPDSAEFYLLKAMEIAPGWIYPYTAMYVNQERQGKGKSDQGEKWLNEAWQIDSNQVLLLNARARFFGYANQIPKAKEMLERSLKLDSTIFCTWNNLGSFYVDGGTDLKKGERIFKKAMSLDPDNPRVYFHLGIIKVNMLLPDSARYYLRKTLKIDSTYGPAYTVWATTYQSEERYEEAEAMYLKSIKAAPDFFPVYFNYGVLKLLTKEPVIADSLFRKSIEMGSEKIKFRFGAGYYCIEHGELELAEKYITECIEIDSTHIDAHFFMAVIRTKQNRYEEAIDYLKKSFEIGNDDYKTTTTYPPLQPLWKREGFKTLLKKYFPDESKK